MKKNCESFRGIKGDGNCFFRSIIFFYLEIILTKESQDERLTGLLDDIILFAKNSNFQTLCYEYSLQSEKEDLHWIIDDKKHAINFIDEIQILRNKA